MQERQIGGTSLTLNSGGVTVMTTMSALTLLQAGEKI